MNVRAVHLVVDAASPTGAFGLALACFQVPDCDCVELLLSSFRMGLHGRSPVFVVYHCEKLEKLVKCFGATTAHF